MGRYQDIKVLRDSDVLKGVRFYATVKYPEIPLSPNDVYVLTNEGDRLDLLAQQYYGNVNLYWIISTANDNLQQNSLLLPPGSQIRIPQDLSSIISAFRNLNSL
jgi:phage tail protein X